MSEKEQKGPGCPRQQENRKRCNCGSTDCSRHGLCCQCVAYHREKGGRPACLR